MIDYHKEKYPNKFHDTDDFTIIGCRGHYLDSEGRKGRNDRNILDDLIIGVNRKTGFYLGVKGNVDPSFEKHRQTGRPLAALNLGVLRFYRGDHKGEYFAFRPFPEGVSLPCTRCGAPSMCANTNLHGCADHVDGNGYDTWSEGCLTMPVTYFKNTFRPLCYEQIEKHHGTVAAVPNLRKLGSKNFDVKGTKHFPLILVEKREVSAGVTRIFAANGEPIF
ncbi:MAG TPA: hypothetical protein VGB00_19370 [Pyrinomonadaceae bacterium]